MKIKQPGGGNTLIDWGLHHCGIPSELAKLNFSFLLCLDPTDVREMTGLDCVNVKYGSRR